MLALVQLQMPVDPQAFEQALTEIAGVQARVEPLAPTRLRVELDLEVDDFLRVLDEVEVHGVPLRGQLTAQRPDDPTAFRQEPEGLALITDPERSFAGRALSIAGCAAMEGRGRSTRRRRLPGRSLGLAPRALRPAAAPVEALPGRSSTRERATRFGRASR